MTTIQATRAPVPDDCNLLAENVWYVGNIPFEMLGFIPAWVDASDTSMCDQINDNYGHGGGWRDFDGFDVNPLSGDMHFPGDPVTIPIAAYRSANEVLWFYRYSWVSVKNLDSGEIRVARID